VYFNMILQQIVFFCLTFWTVECQIGWFSECYNWVPQRTCKFYYFCSVIAEVFILLQCDTLLGNLFPTFLDNAEVSVFKGFLLNLLTLEQEINCLVMWHHIPQEQKPQQRTLFEVDLSKNMANHKSKFNFF